MKNTKGINFFFLIILIITGSKLCQHFDVDNFKFEKPAIDMIYLVTFIAMMALIIKDFFKKTDKE